MNLVSSDSGSLPAVFVCPARTSAAGSAPSALLTAASVSALISSAASLATSLRSFLERLPSVPLRPVNMERERAFWTAPPKPNRPPKSPPPASLAVFCRPGASLSPSLLLPLCVDESISLSARSISARAVSSSALAVSSASEFLASTASANCVSRVLIFSSSSSLAFLAASAFSVASFASTSSLAFSSSALSTAMAAARPNNLRGFAAARMPWPGIFLAGVAAVSSPKLTPLFRALGSSIFLISSSAVVISVWIWSHFSKSFDAMASSKLASSVVIIALSSTALSVEALPSSPLVPPAPAAATAAAAASNAAASASSPSSTSASLRPKDPPPGLLLMSGVVAVASPPRPRLEKSDLKPSPTTATVPPSSDSSSFCGVYGVLRAGVPTMMPAPGGRERRGVLSSSSFFWSRSFWVASSSSISFFWLAASSSAFCFSAATFSFSSSSLCFSSSTLVSASAFAFSAASFSATSASVSASARSRLVSASSAALAAFASSSSASFIRIISSAVRACSSAFRVSAFFISSCDMLSCFLSSLRSSLALPSSLSRCRLRSSSAFCSAFCMKRYSRRLTSSSCPMRVSSPASFMRICSNAFCWASICARTLVWCSFASFSSTASLALSASHISSTRRRFERIRPSGSRFRSSLARKRAWILVTCLCISSRSSRSLSTSERAFLRRKRPWNRVAAWPSSSSSSRCFRARSSLIALVSAFAAICW
mmetsp:Transcript_41350/g.95492  ORF Transcript_41350/g.95492 Transcript_41350/m.95492 type:complete len:714 (-) Transcript_41350:618-2759(-)